ncbi:hypothetical protein MBLNU230_g2800t1 [Neophaeotheca triangularis]
MGSSSSSRDGHGPTKESAKITEWQAQSNPRHFSRRAIIIAGVVAALVIIGLAVGLGVGLTVGKDDESDSSPTSTSIPLPTGSGEVWQPEVGSSWQIVLHDPIELSEDATSIEPDVDVFDIDLFTNDKSTIDTLHRLGKRVICYFAAGSYEPYRPDSSDFKSSDMGKTMDGWEDEKWLDLNSKNVRSIMAKRIALAQDKGCDAVDPDNVDGYNNENGLGLTQQDTIDFMKYLSEEAASVGLAIGLKNAAEVVTEVEPMVQFVVNEQCFEYGECSSFAPLMENDKPVFEIEYPEGAASSRTARVSSQVSEQICSTSGDAAGSERFSKVIKGMDLGGWVEYCDRTIANTPVLIE